MDYKPFKPGVKYDVVLDTKHEYNNVEIVNPVPGFVGLISTWNNGTKSINWVNTSHIVEMCEKRHPMYYWEIEDNKYCLRKDVFSPTKVDMNWEFVLYSDREECKVSIYNLLDGENFSLSDSTIGEFYTNHAAVFGGFHSHKTTVGTYNLNYTTGIKPPSNEIILYKKCVGHPDKNGALKDDDNVIVKLSVPAKAKRVYCGDLKIRVSEATVVDFYHPDGSKYELKDGWCVRSNWDKKFKYHIGATVKPAEKFNPTSGQCGSGIHGFIEFNDAVNY